MLFCEIQSTLYVNSGSATHCRAGSVVFKKTREKWNAWCLKALMYVGDCECCVLVKSAAVWFIARIAKPICYKSSGNCNTPGRCGFAARKGCAVLPRRKHRSVCLQQSGLVRRHVQPAALNGPCGRCNLLCIVERVHLRPWKSRRELMLTSCGQA